MSQSVATILAAAGLLLAFAAASEAASNLDSSRSNCAKAGGTWVVERDGKASCRLSGPAGRPGGEAGLAVSDPGSPADKPAKSKGK